jgi:NADPH2:quinone reductase
LRLLQQGECRHGFACSARGWEFGAFIEFSPGERTENGMKALVCERWAHYSELTLRDDFPRPQLGPGQIRIAVKYATVGFVTTLVVQGKYQRKPPLPFAPGTEIAGHVLEVASDVTTLQELANVGSRVQASGDARVSLHA